MNLFLSSFTLFLLALGATPTTVTSKATPTSGAISISYFEAPGANQLASSDGQWTRVNPLRISHAPHSTQSTQNYQPYGLKPAKPMTVYTDVGLMDNLIPETPREYVKPQKVKVKKYLVNPGYVNPNQPEPRDFVHPYPDTFRPQPNRFQPSQPQNSGINTELLINKFGLVSMKPLLNPKSARQLVPPEPPLQAIESRLMMTPFTFYRANQMFVPLNNQPIPIKTVALALQQARQGSILVQAPPTRVDTNLVGLLAQSERKYGFEDEAARLYAAATNAIYEGEVAPRATTKKESWKRMDQDEVEPVGVAFFAPDFKRLTKSRRMRVSTLGSLGYQS